MIKVGFIGLGIMGYPMAKHLIKAGNEVYVNDINKESVEKAVQDGAISASLKEIGENCEVVFTILPNGEIVDNVLFGKDGIAEFMEKGIICDLSSVTPLQSVSFYERLKAKGVKFVDAPVSGGEPGAINGTLAIMCGGDEETVDELRPIMDCFSSSITYVGKSGSGNITKLANQIIVNLNIVAVSEALVLATKAGANPRLVYEAIRGGLAGSAVLDAKAPLIIERKFEPGGKISINSKDINNVLSTAEDLDVPLPFTSMLQKVQQELKEKGHFEEDHGAYVKYFEELANVQVREKKENN